MSWRSCSRGPVSRRLRPCQRRPWPWPRSSTRLPRSSLLLRSAVAGSLVGVVRLLASRRVLAVGVCSVLGGPLFMGGYIAAVILAGPSDALTATATYPVIGAILARVLLRQRLHRVAWLGVTVTAAGAALITVDASGSDDSVKVLVGIGVALAAAAAVALEGIVATRAMVGLDTNTVMAVRELLSAIMFGAGSARGAERDRHSGHDRDRHPPDRAHRLRRCDRRLLVRDLVSIDPHHRRRTSDGVEHLLRVVGCLLRVGACATLPRRCWRSAGVPWSRPVPC